ncbi:MFS transporter [Bifidobacterium parmae]|uniref:Sodium:galactoside symporter n=1 Tax=Bifidobacterium parmae TaxID=361854 RepID=A0A2N5IYV0_9BIFI|nr:MFS transporter [Bifidobacterium parmae]PLS27135.1 sodium:galactoside symporter [Bifidobacterium parmae]
MTQHDKTPEAKAPQGRKITMKNAFGFGLGDFYGGGFGQTATYLPVFWVTFAGLAVDQATSIMGIATILSAFAALVVGTLSDNFYRYRIGRRFGRRRFFLMAGIPLLLVTAIVWIPGLPVWLYFIGYALWIIANQLIMTPYSALPTEMTTDFDGRTKLSTVRMFVSGVTSSGISLLMAAALAGMGEDHAYAYQISMVGLIGLFCIALFICYKSTWEFTPEQAGFDVEKIEAEAGQPFDFGKWLKNVADIFVGYFSTLRIKSFRKHVLIYLLGQTFMDVFGQTWLFFVIYDWNKTAAFASLLLSFALIAEPFKPVFGWLFARLGPRNMFSLNFAGGIIGLVGLFGLWQAQRTMPQNVWTVLAFVVSVWWFIFRAMVWFIPWNVFPFIPDVDEIVTGKNRSGVFVGFQLFLRKLTSGLATTFIGLYLATTGFVKPAKDASGAMQYPSQPISAQNGIAFVCIGWVIIGLIIAWIIALTFKLDKRTDGILLKEIDRLRNGGLKKDVDPETKKVVEQLTGIRYEQCWPQTTE